MAKWIAALLIVGCVCGCDSPMNHRIEPQNATKAQKMQDLAFAQYDYSVQAFWLQGPFGSLSKVNHLLVMVYDRAGRLASLPQGLHLSFYATMPSMGHPLDDPGFFEQIEPGVYLNKTIRYNMPGDWKNELWVMDLDDNIKDRAIWHEQF